MTRKAKNRHATRYRWAVWALVLFIALVTAGCAKKAIEAEKKMPVPVLAAVVQVKDMPVQVTGIGTVEAYSTVSVKSLVSGSLDQVHFTEGREVKKDDPLFTIDPRPYQADIQRAEANLARDAAQLAQAEANVARDQANAQNGAVEKRRYQALVEKGVSARQLLDQATATADALDAAVRADQASVENARAAIAADRAAVETSKLNLQYCYIHAPIGGLAGSLLVHQGNIIKSNDTTLVVINQLRPIYVDFSVPQQGLPAIHEYVAKGKVRVEASIPNDTAPVVAGELSFIDNTVNTTTGTILLKGVFENSQGRLWPGLFVNVTVTLATQPNAVVVPSQAVQVGQAGQYVYVVKSDMTAESRPVTVSRILGELSIIEKGLQPGETVVTDGQIRLVPGALVQIKKAL
jgi:multidrug efflux system membrane fusion protein